MRTIHFSNESVLGVHDVGRDERFSLILCKTIICKKQEINRRHTHVKIQAR